MILDLIILAVSLLERLVVALVFLEGQVLAQLLEIARQVLRAVHHAFHVAHANLLRVDVAEDLRVADAFDGRRAVNPDVALAVVVDRVRPVELVHLDQDERNGAFLAIEANVHALLQHALSDRALNLLVSLHQTLNLNLLLDHALQLDHLGLDSLALIEGVPSEQIVFFIELSLSACLDWFLIFTRFLLSTVFAVGNFLHSTFDIGAEVLKVADVDHLLELVGEVLVEVHVQRHLLLLLREDVAGEEYVEGVIDASAQVFDSLAVNLLLLSVLDVKCGILTAEAILVNGRVQQVQSRGLRVRDVVADLLVGRSTLLKQDLEDFLGDCAQAAVGVEVSITIGILGFRVGKFVDHGSLLKITLLQHVVGLFGRGTRDIRGDGWSARLH